MDRDLAKNLLIELRKSWKSLDQAEVIARQIENEEESLEVRRAFAEVSMSLYTHAMGKIFVQYPDLDEHAVKSRKK